MNLTERPVKRWLSDFWSKDQSLTVLLFVLGLHLFVVIPLQQKGLAGDAVFSIFYLLVLLAGFRYLAIRGWVRRILVSVLVIVILIGLLQQEEGPWAAILQDLSGMVYWMLLAGIVMARTFSDGPVTWHRIQGSVVCYLIIGLLFAQAYHLVHVLAGAEAFTTVFGGTREEFTYFSLTTLTTVGYGDVLPRDPFARSLSNLEALTGQLYPVILIARLVSMEYEWSRRKGRGEVSNDPS